MEKEQHQEGCPCCGSPLSLIHYRGCPNTHIEWKFRDNMRPMPRENAEALMELAQLMSDIPPPGPDHLLACEKP